MLHHFCTQKEGTGVSTSLGRWLLEFGLLCMVRQPSRHWKDHFKSDLRSDQDHRLKKYLRSDQDQIFLKNDLDLKSRSKIIFCLKSPLFEYFKKKIALLIFKVNFFSVLNCLASNICFLEWTNCVASAKNTAELPERKKKMI
jgi:hypothetical protein